LISNRKSGLRKWLEVCRTYRRQHGRWPNLLAPRRYTEKIQLRKLLDRDPRHAIFCDKLAVRDYAAARADPEILVPLLWSGGLDELPFHLLERPVALKSSHACAQVMLFDGKQQVDRAAVAALASAWLAEPYGVLLHEPGYWNVPRRLMIEQLLTDEHGAPPLEARLFVFDGVVRVVNTVFTEDGKVRNGAFHTPDWVRLDWHFTRWVGDDFAPPRRLTEMIRVAELLAAGQEHLRVDFYDCGAKFWLGEITVYPWSGLAKFAPDAADFQLGAYWKQPRFWRARKN
jgi:hypothetical protein